MLISGLACWSVKHNITQSALNDLLNVLQKTFPDLPKCAKTVLQTSKFPTSVIDNSYCYIGINGLLLGGHIEQSVDRTVSIQINVDGLPLFKSSMMQLWPILGLVEIFDGILQCNKKPFLIALDCDGKPKDIGAFLKDFVNEVNELESQGLMFNGYHYVVKVSAIICDTPARSFIKCNKGHNAYNGCDKCEQLGKFIGVAFPETNAKLRTDLSFATMSDGKHHIMVSPLNRTSIGLISQVPHDYMHLVCLGVMRKLIYAWIQGPLNTRLGPCVVQQLSEKMITLRPHVRSEFARKPRSFREFEQWKASEFRQFLLYTGMVCLKDVLSERLYNNFMLLCVGMSILLSE